MARLSGDTAAPPANHQLEESGWITVRARDGFEARGLVVVRGKLQRAAAAPLQVIAVMLKRAIVLQRVEECAA
jgi:hypothetical protein